MRLRSVALWAACALGGSFAQAATSDAAVTPLAFPDFYKHPVGPRGLEPSDRLLSLTGARVRLAGFVVQRADTAARVIILSPVPVALSDEDESLADDLPPGIAYVDAADPLLAETMTRCRGPVAVTGRLATGARREADDRISFVRLQAESAQCAQAAAPGQH